MLQNFSRTESNIIKNRVNTLNLRVLDGLGKNVSPEDFTDVQAVNKLVMQAPQGKP